MNAKSEAATPECQTPGVGEAACTLPWSGDPRAEDKTLVWKLVAERPEGVNLPFLVRTVFGRDTDMAGADAQLIRRLIKDHPDLFQIGTARLGKFPAHILRDARVIPQLVGLTRKPPPNVFMNTN